MPNLIEGVDSVKGRYQEQDIANEYERSRFDTLLGRLMHIQEIEGINKALSFRPSNILEVATGPARISKAIKLHTSLTAIGVDSSIPMLKIAKQNVEDERWSFICGDAMNMPFPNASFNVLITFHFVRHLAAPERARVFREFSRVLKVGGVLVMDVLNAERGVVARGFDKAHGLAQRAITGSRGIYDVRYTKTGFQQELADSGFELESLYGVAHFYSAHLILDLPFDLIRYIKQRYLRKDVGTSYRWVRDKFVSFALRIEHAQNRDKGYLWVATCVKKEE